ncbi:MAG: PcfJ domain-containing protein [Deltaproteobacteria bacterium]|nr:PcfJ domain-containing protein [Deltaproteobacteria bacterium]
MRPIRSLNGGSIAEMIVHELNTGILIECDGRNVATVETGRNAIEITVRRGGQRAFAASRAGVRAAVDLLARYVRIAPKQRTSGEKFGTQADLFAFGPQRARAVGEQDIERYLLAALRRAARRQTDDIDAIEAAVGRERATPLVFSSAVLDAAFFTRDVVRFRSAAIAAAFIETLPIGSESADCAAAMRPHFQSWRSLFSPKREASRALNKTLADPPVDAAAADLWALRLVQLERPIRSGLHLRVLAQRARGRERARDEHLALIQHAEESELLDLRARVARALGLERAAETERDHVFAEVVGGAGPRVGAETLRALVRRSIVDARGSAKSGGLSPSMPTRPPPIPPPKGGRFLATVGELIREGELMHHCVGSHARDAVDGETFIFHVQVGGEHATVEVAASGDVIDASGPCNQSNGAARYARRTFAAWGRRLNAETVRNAARRP